MIFAATCECRSNSPTTEGKLDLETDEVICQECGLTLEGISKFIKTSMKLTKDVIKKERRAFSFKCERHQKITEVFFENSKVMGKDCHQEDGECQINITKAMKTAIKEYTNNEK